MQALYKEKTRQQLRKKAFINNNIDNNENKSDEVKKNIILSIS